MSDLKKLSKKLSDAIKECDVRSTGVYGGTTTYVEILGRQNTLIMW